MLCKLQLDDRVQTMRVPPDADDLQANAFVQFLVIRLGAVARAETGHEFPIEGG